MQKINKNNIPYKSENFQKILDFYLFKCPVVVNKRKISQKGKTFEELNIIGSELSSLLNDMKRSAEFHCIDHNQSADKKFEEIQKNSSLSDKNFNLVVYTENFQIKKTKTIFYYIRNAFAHGDFSVKNIAGHNIYTLCSSKNGVVKGVFRLKEKTLLQWIELVADHSNKTKKKKLKKAG